MQYPIGSPTCWDENNTNCAIKDAQCSYGCVNRSGVEIKAMANYDKGMRLIINQGITSRGFRDPYPDMQRTTGWLPPSKMGGQFSATCWFFGRDVYAKQAVGRTRATRTARTARYSSQLCLHSFYSSLKLHSI